MRVKISSNILNPFRYYNGKRQDHLLFLKLRWSILEFYVDLLKYIFICLKVPSFYLKKVTNYLLACIGQINYNISRRVINKKKDQVKMIMDIYNTLFSRVYF